MKTHCHKYFLYLATNSSNNQTFMTNNNLAVGKLRQRQQIKVSINNKYIIIRIIETERYKDYIK